MMTPIAMSAKSSAAPTPTPTPMPILAPLERPESEESCEGLPPPDEPVCEGLLPDDTPEAGVAVGVKSTLIRDARDVAYATGKRDRSLASQAT